ncbi:RDD family protein [Flavobacterium cellulosilyticum]|uniref:RDD family protein n=1 Tax=Flavobacterium cellulosilyticum TaxID=2541731 RepID=A0A4R5CHS8_9FLAO|nr:RDD family protein [Flavobacterium cellulosilyticum]TDD99305.1 RDD family protein [Flavobacterium cellulosilyticum]
MENKEFTVTNDLLATRGQRSLNCILDLLIVHTIIVSIGTTVVIIGDLTSNYNLTNWAESRTTLEKLLLWAVIVFLYYFLTETYFSQTFAKYFTKTIVVTKEGSRPKLHKIFIRTLTRFIPLEGLTFLSSNIRGLHDLFSNTYVVKKHELNHKKGVIAFP